MYSDCSAFYWTVATLDKPTAYDPAHVLAWSEQQTQNGVTAPHVYLWTTTQPAAVLGLSQDASRELDLDHLNQDGVTILRRASGGGAVLLLPGTLCFGVIAPATAEHTGMGIHDAFRMLTLPVIEALHGLGINANLCGISDIAATDPEHGSTELFKVAGTAQLRKRDAILVHGTILVDADLRLLAHYLPYPSDTPAYRNERCHEDFCRNLNDLTPEPLCIARVAAALGTACSVHGWTWIEPPMSLDAGATTLYQGKYNSDEWTFERKRPKNG